MGTLIQYFVAAALFTVFVSFSIYMTVVVIQILWPFILLTACASIAFVLIAVLTGK